MDNGIAHRIIEHAQNGISIYISNGLLKVKAPEGNLTELERLELKNNKELILKLFAAWGVKSNDNIGLLSYQQQRLWLIDKIEQGSAQYNVPWALKFDGRLDPDALRRALSAILDRHQILKTIYKLDHRGEGIQVILEAAELALPIVDLSHLAGAEQAQEVSRLTEAEASLPFDLSSDLMLRSTLIRLSAESWVLLLTFHHIAVDGGSRGILTSELSALYAAVLQGQENPLPPLPIQYIDYAHWQRHRMQGEVLARQLGYWAHHLRGLPSVHNLPLDHARPATPTYRGGMLAQFLGSELQQSLNTFSRSHEVTLFMVLHAAFVSLLSRYSSEHDIVVGSPIASREKTELAPLVGFFMNTLVLRSDLSADPGFIDFLAQSKQRLLAAYEHQQIPFEKLVDELKPERSLRHNPLFQVMLILHNNEQSQMNLPGLTLRSVKETGTVSKFDLTLSVTENPNQSGMHLVWEYAADLFEASTIERMAGHFEILLKGIIANPAIKVSRLPLLTAVERNRLLVEWNNTAAHYPQARCMHELFEKQVEQNPTAVALVYENQQLTYGQLNEHANRLAHYLVIAKQVRPDTRVGVCLERSLEMVVAILGVLKAGGAYVPLDPEYPQARVAYMLEDAGLETVITTSGMLGSTPITQQQAVCLDDMTLRQKLAVMPVTNLKLKERYLTARNLAYVIYTSGSTGKPKGVMIEHASLVNFLVSMSNDPGMSAADILLAVTSTSFDIHGLELFLPLVTGARVVIAARSDTTDANRLIQLLEDQQVSVMQATPATWKMLLAAQWSPGWPIKLLCGGEAWGPALQQGLLASENVSLWNMYGPTETTIWSSIRRIKREDKEINIGPAIANTQFYVFDRNFELCPIGVPGELFISGAGLARGYLNRQELTNERFLINPFLANAKMYRTGDLVRWLPDGNLQFMGRIDHQVKIRGFRIELGEIEHLLASHGLVKDAVVVDRDSIDGDRQLFAYVVPQVAGVPLKDESLRDHLRENLPDYMVPSVFIFLESLPLTPNGKVDRKALPDPDLSVLTAQYVAPQTDTERRLCEIWQALLGVERAGVHDNFFRLGGHSLSATRLANNIQSEFGVAPSVRQIFSYSSLQEMSLGIDELTSAVTRSGGEEINFDVLDMEMPPKEVESIEVNNGSYEVLRHFTISVILNINLKVIEWDRLCAALNLLVNRHEGLRLRACPNREGMQIKFAPKGEEFRIERVQYPHPDNENGLSGLRNLCNELIRGFKFTPDSPLFKVLLIDRCGQAPDKLLMVWHHWIVDGVGVEIAVTDLLEGYKKLASGSDSNWPKSSHSIYHWISTQIDYARSMRGIDEARYWLAKPWEIIKRLPGDTDLEAARLLRDQNFTVAQKQAMERLWRGAKLNRAECATLSGLNWNSLSKELTAELAAFEVRKADFELADIVLLAVFRAVKEWTGERLMLMDFYLSGRTIETFGLDMSRSVCNMAYRCPVFVEEVDPKNLLTSLQAIKAMRTEAPYDGAYHQAVKYHVADKLVRQSMQRPPVPQINVNYIPDVGGGVGKKLIDGIWLDDTHLNLMNNHPRLFAADRIYFQVNTYKGRLNCGCVTQGYDYEDAYFKGEYHPARSIYLSRLFIEHITGIIRSLGACDWPPFTASRLTTVELQD